MNDSALWVFGYGSLIWEPGFAVAEHQIARVEGYHRSFCMRSIHHRGTVDDPGLVLALDQAEGAHCDGVAYRVQTGAEDQTLEYLRARELISSAYLEVQVDVHMKQGQSTQATCFVIDPEHEQYCGGLPLAEQARIIARSIGGRGPNWDYLYNTAQHLKDLGLEDPELEWLSREVAAIRGGRD